MDFSKKLMKFALKKSAAKLLNDLFFSSRLRFM